MPDKPKRIVSLLPSTTEIVCALGLEAQLVGRSHECDFPESVKQLPSCTEPKFDPDGTSYQINERVKALLQEGLSIYRVDADLLAGLNPDIILTQDHCEVCAVSFSEVREAVQQYAGSGTEVISVSPTDVDGVFDSIRQIAETLAAKKEGQALIKRMKTQFQSLKQQTKGLPVKNVLCLEWLDPLMTAGNWVPELVHIAGGNTPEAKPGAHSPWIDRETIIDADPDVIAIMPCGYPIQQSMEEVHKLKELKGWHSLQAVRNHNVFVLEGNQYFNRPGPRLTDSARILAEILHPEVFSPFFQHKGWVNLNQQLQTSVHNE